MDKSSSFLTTPVAILLGSFVISVSILMHGGIIKLGSKTAGTQANVPAASALPQQEAPQPTSAKISVDDDPVIGDKDAPVTLVEFSDYECPFCKRHFDQVYPVLKKDYIDTGKVKMVFRDYPLPFHEPMATFEANAANCAREQGGDSAYFSFHDAIFTKTKSNGNGLTKDEVYQLAAEEGINQTTLKTCADSSKYAEEIKKDTSDGSTAGVSGTPSFFIGKSDPSGTFTGQIIVGAQPYSAFQAIIDPLLK
ncbi:DsbA family protein [Candidatus Daviesbacteria bacterium]|nr:DsbA family protein [Candidatus Daviesbacteria bacterium]